VIHAFSSLGNHNASRVAAQAAMFLASMVDNATEICCFDCQLITQQPSKNKKQLTDLLVSMQRARSEFY